MATININGQLILDQTAGVDPGDIDVSATLGGLDSDFATFLNSLGLSAGQKNFAAFVDGASDPDLVTVTPGLNESVKSLFFSDAQGDALNGDLVDGVTLLDGSPLYMWSADGGHVVLISTSNVAGFGADTIAAAFYIESTDATNTVAGVQSITFQPLLHPDANDPNDAVDFSNILNVSASVVVSKPIGDDIIVLDDAPTIVTSDDGVNLVVDESDLATDDSKSYADQFTTNFGTDGEGDIDYTLEVTAGASGLTDTASGQAVILSMNGTVVEGKTAVDGDLVFTVSVDDNANVTLNQIRAVVHTDSPDNYDEDTTLSADTLVRLVGTITDGDGDTKSDTLNIGQNLIFGDDGPTLGVSAELPDVVVDETNLGLPAGTGNFLPVFDPEFGADGGSGIDFDLDFNALSIVGLTDTESGEAISLSKVGDVIEARTASNLLVFTVSVSALGVVSLEQARAVTHADTDDHNDVRTLGAADAITLTATITDGDGDEASQTINIGQTLQLYDDGPEVTVPVVNLAMANQTQVSTEDFGYDIGNDKMLYVGSNSDFVGADLALTGEAGGVDFTATTVDRVSENAASAVFDFSFSYDKDPITAGVQTATTTGTLTFDKINDSYSVQLDAPVEGFSFSVLHTNELLAKAPPGNTGHPEIVVTKLDTDFFVQFTANSNPNGNPFGFNTTDDGPPSAGNTAFNNGEHVASNFEDWVSATQTTNGVAGDTIQKGELLTLRFYEDDILSSVNPNAPGGGNEHPAADRTAVDAIAVKFDGIGNSEDLMAVVSLVDNMGTVDTTDDVHTTRAIRVDNADLYKGNTVPSPYNTEFSLDNNDALLIIESNDWNVNPGEDFQLEGIQFMQSANGLTGTAINLNKAIGAAGNSTGTQAWDALDNDVLKIVDIGFIEASSGGNDASLDFAFQINDGDGDVTQLLGIHVDILNDLNI